MTATAVGIIEDVRRGGEAALRTLTERLDGRSSTDPLYYTGDDLQQARARMAQDDRVRLERIANRIESFACAQRDALAPMTMAIPGGEAGHVIAPVERAGCYAPGGRYPLPSSVLMTAVTARAAGVESVWVASPQPAPVTLAAAAVAGADGLLAAGGAQAIAALAFGTGPVPPSDVVVGPGNRYVTAAKQLLAGHVGIDMLAGPSELVVMADDAADAALIARDLLAQAEHDPEAKPILLAFDDATVCRVESALEDQLASLPTAPVARDALRNGGAIVCDTMDEAINAANTLAPEHLQLCVTDPDAIVSRLAHYGALFIGDATGEVLGDYGAGPNHVLPTGGTARNTGGLSVMTFLRIRTWMRVTGGNNTTQLAEDAAWLARQEGLEAHARAAEARSLSYPR